MARVKTFGVGITFAVIVAGLSGWERTVGGMAEVPLELEIAREAYLVALDRWLLDPHRREIHSRARAELAAASQRLTETLRELGVPEGDRRRMRGMPERPFG